MKYFIQVYGCAASIADGERVSSMYAAKNWERTHDEMLADEIVIVTCSIRQSAEDRVMGFVRNIAKEKQKGRKVKVILTGCMVGMALRDPSQTLLKRFKKNMPGVDEFLSIEEVAFSYPQLREHKSHALVTVSNGCNNFCSYCVVPFARGKEISRPYEEIIHECKELAKNGFTKITLVGQNVNSYGSDLVKRLGNGKQIQLQGRIIKPVYVKHLGKMRIPTLFPYLLDDVCQIPGIQSVDFISSNPWDFSKELTKVIAKNKNCSRLIHLPVQSGDKTVLKRMNRWYSPKEYKELIQLIRTSIPEATFSTDIIVGFPGETKKQFEHTIELCKDIGFLKAYISMYSDRPSTYAHTNLKDTISYEEKKRRWEILDELINKTNLRKGIYPLYE